MRSWQERLMGPGPCCLVGLAGGGGGASWEGVCWVLGVCGMGSLLGEACVGGDSLQRRLDGVEAREASEWLGCWGR